MFLIVTQVKEHNTSVVKLSWLPPLAFTKMTVVLLRNVIFLENSRSVKYNLTILKHPVKVSIMQQQVIPIHIIIMLLYIWRDQNYLREAMHYSSGVVFLLAGGWWRPHLQEFFRKHAAFKYLLVEANIFQVTYICNEFLSWEHTGCILCLNCKSIGQRECAASYSQESYKHYFRWRMTHNFRESLSLGVLVPEGFIQWGWICCSKHPSLNVTRWCEEVSIIHEGGLWHREQSHEQWTGKIHFT